MERDLNPGLNHAERDYYDWLAHKLPEKLVLRDGTPVIEIPQLSWEQRARLAEEKIQSLVDGLMSDEAWDRMMTYNPLAVAIARTAVQRFLDGD
jgi:hypothetical protein